MTRRGEFIAVLLLNLFLGTLYAWSVVARAAENEFDLGRADTSGVFSTATACFVLAMLLAPRLYPRLAPRSLALLAAGTAASGLLLAAVAGSLPGLLVGYGILFGLGNGIGYGLSLQVAMGAASRRGLAVGAAFGLVPAAISFAAGVLASMALRVISPSRVYDAIDWPVVVLLGALIPVAGAMATTGTADLIARALLEYISQGHAIVALALILIVTMTLSDFMNNAATAAVMCPIALGTAQTLGANADPFLMAVAVGASCAFLTPIGH